MLGFSAFKARVMPAAKPPPPMGITTAVHWGACSKSSNPQVMVQAYRLLVQKMDEEFGECYPLHLGVTEAGYVVLSTISAIEMLSFDEMDFLEVWLTEKGIETFEQLQEMFPDVEIMNIDDGIEFIMMQQEIADDGE